MATTSLTFKEPQPVPPVLESDEENDDEKLAIFRHFLLLSLKLFNIFILIQVKESALCCIFVLMMTLQWYQ